MIALMTSGRTRCARSQLERVLRNAFHVTLTFFPPGRTKADSKPPLSSISRNFAAAEGRHSLPF